MHQPPLSARFAALAIGIGAVLSVALMSHHPWVHTETLAEMVAEVAREGELSRFVHGSLIPVMAITFFGFTGLADHLGWNRGRTRAGSLAYFLGLICMLGAALVSGFVVSGLADRYIDAPAEEIETLRPIFHLCWETNQALAKTGTWALSAAIVLWSLALLGRGAWAKGLAILGLIVGLLPVVGLFTGHLRLHVHGMGAVVLAQALWSIGIAAWLYRAPERSDPNEPLPRAL